VTSTLLVAARVIHTGRLTYAFLVTTCSGPIPLALRRPPVCPPVAPRPGAALTAPCGAAGWCSS
jgi:hypothetical protein